MIDPAVILKIINEIKGYIDTAKSNSEVARSLVRHLDIVDKVVQPLKGRSETDLAVYSAALDGLNACLTSIKTFLDDYKPDGKWYDFWKVLEAKGNQKKLTKHTKDLFEYVLQLNLGVSASSYFKLEDINKILQDFSQAFERDYQQIEAELHRLEQELQRSRERQEVVIQTLEELQGEGGEQAAKIQEKLEVNRENLEKIVTDLTRVQAQLTELDLSGRLDALKADLEEIKQELKKQHRSGLEMREEIDTLRATGPDSLAMDFTGARQLTAEQHQQEMAAGAALHAQGAALGISTTRIVGGTVAEAGGTAMRHPQAMSLEGMNLAREGKGLPRLDEEPAQPPPPHPGAMAPGGPMHAPAPPPSAPAAQVAAPAPGGGSPGSKKK